MDERAIRSYLVDAGLLGKGKVLGDDDLANIIRHLRSAELMLAKKASKGELRNVFVDNFLSAGNEVVDDVTFFFDEYIFSVENFNRNDGYADYVVDYVKGLIHGYRISAKEFDFGPVVAGRRRSVAKSELAVTFVMRGANVHVDQSRWIFRAYGKNCLWLEKLIRGLIIPNMTPKEAK